MKVGQKWLASGDECEVSKEIYEAHKTHFLTTGQAARSKKNKELGAEVEALKLEVAKLQKDNETLKSALDSSKSENKDAGDK